MYYVIKDYFYILKNKLTSLYYVVYYTRQYSTKLKKSYNTYTYYTHKV